MDFQNYNRVDTKSEESKSVENEDEAVKVSEESKDNEEEEYEPNILKALLFHMLDTLALEFMGYYSENLNEDLFLFTLEKNNKEFIKTSLVMGAFNKQMF